MDLAYCTTCGMKLLLKWTKNRGYSEGTGKPIYQMYYTCPNFVWWKWWDLPIHRTQHLWREIQ